MAPPFLLRNVGSNIEGFGQIAALFDHACESKQGQISVDCSSVTWFDANQAAALGAVAQLLRIRENRNLAFLNLPKKVRDILICNGLLKSDSVTRRATVVPLHHFNPGDARKFAGYTQDHLSNKGIPAMSSQLKMRFFEVIDELFQNCEIHSKTEHGMFACGQLYPRTNRLDFSLVDLGIGFAEVIHRGLGIRLPPAEAIAWAMTGSNTTRAGDVPGGLGLKILKEFIQLNGGRLLIVSHKGYWCLQKNGVEKKELLLPFPGTAITLEVNLADRMEYRMKHEIDPSAVF